MTKSVWTRCETSLPKPWYLNPTETRTFYHLEYYQGGYQASPNNLRISNFKKKIENKTNSSCWKYKQDAIRYFANQIIANKNFPFNDIAFMAIPTSKKRDDIKFDSRLEDVLDILQQHGQWIEKRLDVKKSTVETHYQDNRRDPNKLIKNLLFQPFTISEKLPHTIILIDDIVTTGAHFIACKKLINEYHPQINFGGFFLGKAMHCLPPGRQS